MIRFKVDEYAVWEKGRLHSVLVFPFVKYMWTFDDWGEEPCYMVDGTAEAFSLLKYAMAILIEASDKIVYFPCKQEGIGRVYDENYNLVICTPKAQLRRSSWVAIRRKLNNANKVGSYTLQYDRKKLDDYCKKELMEWEGIGIREGYWLRVNVGKYIEKVHLEECIGENVFFVLSKEECYHNHYRIAKDLDEYCSGDEYGAWSAMGWFITPKGIARMKERAKKQEAESGG